MSPRIKKLIGTIVTLVWIVIYVGLVIGVAVRILPHANGLEAFLFYAVAGTLWAVPVGLMFPWMYRDANNDG